MGGVMADMNDLENLMTPQAIVGFLAAIVRTHRAKSRPAGVTQPPRPQAPPVVPMAPRPAPYQPIDYNSHEPPTYGPSFGSYSVDLQAPPRDTADERIRQLEEANRKQAQELGEIKQQLGLLLQALGAK